MDEKSTDLEYVIFLKEHIDNPCKDLYGNNCRGAYLREGERVLQEHQFENPFAKQYLEQTIQKYRAMERK